MTAPPASASSPRLQARVAIPLFLLVFSFLVGLDLLARNDQVAAALDRAEEASCRQTKTSFLRLGNWLSLEEAWMYDELPKLDLSRGGVYLFGSSEVQVATAFYKLDPNLRALLHNFGMAAANPRGELIELQYLIEQCGLLRAGPEKSLIVLGADCQTSYLTGHDLAPAYVDSWTRRGLFLCDPQTGIQPVPENPAARWVNFEVTRIGGFLGQLRNQGRHLLIRWRHHGVEPPRVNDIATYLEGRRAVMEPNWKEKIDNNVQTFRETLDYLQARHVPIRVVVMPAGTWCVDLPYELEYHRQILALCASKQVPVSDWLTMLSDGDYSDPIHMSIFGMEKFQPAFLDFALPFLRATGAL